MITYECPPKLSAWRSYRSTKLIPYALACFYVLLWREKKKKNYLRSEERMRLQSLGLDHQLHDTVQGAVVQNGSLPAGEEVGDDAFEQRQVHF